MAHVDLTFSRTTASPVLVPQAVGAVEAVFMAVGRLMQDATRYRTAVGHVMEGVPAEVAGAGGRSPAPGAAG